MTEQEKRIKKEGFEWWITCLPDRIEELQQKVEIPLNESLDSLDDIEKFIIENFSVEFLKSNEGKEVLDQLASYIGSTIKKLVPNSKWHIELEDESDIYYSIPSLRSDNHPAISPYILPITIASKKKEGLLRRKIENRIANANTER